MAGATHLSRPGMDETWCGLDEHDPAIQSTLGEQHANCIRCLLMVMKALRERIKRLPAPGPEHWPPGHYNTPDGLIVVTDLGPDPSAPTGRNIQVERL